MAFFSQNSADYAAAISALKKPTYESKYNNLIEDTLNKILNKEDFSYDFNADPLYQNYKDQYTKLGKEASINAAAAASTLTGGYGNSYAGTAASQANQQYLTQLNDVIPDLYNAAMNKYQMEKEDLYNKFGVVQGEEQRLYGQYRDTVSDYYSDLSDLRSGHSTAQAHEEWLAQMEYQKDRDAVSDSQWNRTFDYNAGRDTVADTQWQKEFDTKVDQWQKEYELALKKLKSSGSSSKSGSGSSSSGSKLNSKLNPYYEKALEWSNNTNAGDIDRVDKYLNQLISQKLISQSDAYKIYNAVMDDNPYYLNLMASKKK